MPTDKPEIRLDASEKSPTPWGTRILQALNGKPQAWLAREAGINTTTLGDMIRKTMPNADAAIRIARVLDVPVEWLVTGETPVGRSRLMAADEADWIVVPHYRLADFTETSKPDPIDLVPLRKDWLNRNARTATKLWLTELPSTVEGVGEEGDTILCRDVETHEHEGLYLYFYDGLAIVRQVKGPMPGQLAEQPAWAWQPDETPGLRLVARVLGTIKLRAV